MNGTAHVNGSAHLTLVRTPSAAELEQMVDLAGDERRSASRPAALRPAPLRLTRRGRLVAVAIFLLTLLAGGVLFGSTSTRATNEPGVPQSYRYVVVQPGETLWGIAKEVAPGADPRATIESIRRLNSLSDTGVQAGQRLALP